ncbi:MAG: bifunctional demethylmenaquinone methyltransferase/2-methoxy-6-polyprenyl-1,4-benzoquinol methylase UbiE [bacterium]
MTQERTVSFGFENVAASEKAGKVRAVFDSVASNYDIMNDLMSAGVHRLWKSVLLDRINPQPGMKLLDMAGGTGDIALSFLQRAALRPARHRPKAQAVISDINHTMLKAGKDRDQQSGLTSQVTRLCTDAQNLPFADNQFDIYTIGFGIRNVTDMSSALREAYRVLKPGGRFFCLEFSHPVTEGLQQGYDAYSFNIIPRLGELVANDRDSYQYLVESIRRFPHQDQFLSMIQQANFQRCRYENLSLGIAAIHSGWKF